MLCYRYKYQMGVIQYDGKRVYGNNRIIERLHWKI